MLIEQIDPTIVVAVIGLVGAVLSVSLPYFFARNKEINASIRQERTRRYDDLIEALAAMYNAVSNPVDKKVLHGTVKNFVTAYNRASTYASDQVL